MIIPERKLPILGIYQVIRLIGQQGGNTDNLLQGAGISANQLSDPSSCISRAQELRLLSHILKQYPDPFFGLKAGCYYRLSAFGALGSAMFAAQNAKEAIQFFVRFINLSYTYFDVVLSQGKTRTILTLHSLYDLGELYPYFVQRDLAFAVTAAGDVIPRAITEAGLQIEVALPEPINREPYDQLFQCPLHFGCEVTRISFKNTVLEYPLPQANELSLKMLELQCEKNLRKLTSSKRSSETVRTFLNQAQGYPTEDAIADYMAITTRTLRRHLAKEGTHYQQLVDGHLYTNAKSLLVSTTLSISKIADKLGYSESASFIRAFKRWHGTSPAVYRKQQQRCD